MSFLLSTVKHVCQIVRCVLNHSVQVSSVSCLIGSPWVGNEQFSTDPLPVFSAGGPCEQFWRGQGCPLFDVVHPAFPLPTTASPILQREAVVACDMPYGIKHSQT